MTKGSREALLVGAAVMVRGPGALAIWRVHHTDPAVQPAGPRKYVELSAKCSVCAEEAWRVDQDVIE